MPPETVLLLDALTIRYRDCTAVDRLSLEVRRGEIYGLLGPNGCGKSSTLSAIVGAIAPSGGEVWVSGRREAVAPLAYRRSLGLVPQELALYEELTGAQNLAFFGSLYGLSGQALRRRIAFVLDFVRLTEHARRPVRSYSGGMQRRLNLACALLHEPELLLLDEPTVGLDIQSRDAIFDSLRVLREDGTGIVFTTHHLEEAELLCDRLAIMDHGRLITEGTLSDLCGNTSEATLLPVGYRLDPPHTIRRPLGLERIFLELTGRGLRDP